MWYVIERGVALWGYGETREEAYEDTVLSFDLHQEESPAESKIGLSRQGNSQFFYVFVDDEEQIEMAEPITGRQFNQAVVELTDTLGGDFNVCEELKNLFECLLLERNRKEQTK